MKVRVNIRPKALLVILAKRNMSQNSLGRVANLQSGHVSQLISGKRNISPTTREKILRALDGIQFDEIFAIREQK